MGTKKYVQGFICGSFEFQKKKPRKKICVQNIVKYLKLKHRRHTFFVGYLGFSKLLMRKNLNAINANAMSNQTGWELNFLLTFAIRPFLCAIHQTHSSLVRFGRKTLTNMSSLFIVHSFIGVVFTSGIDRGASVVSCQFGKLNGTKRRERKKMGKCI